MKTIKINFVGVYDSFDKNNNIFINILSRHYNIEISDKPDYIFCTMFGKPYEYCNYSGIRIFFSGENFTPDFNLVDYAIGYDFISYEDRFFRYPVFLWEDISKKLQNKHKYVNTETLNTKSHFCNFIYGNSNVQSTRKELFDVLSTYKKVDSTGTYLNNTTPHFITKTVSEKLNFQEKCKFTIACDSVCQNGFITEKIMHAFVSNTIPIYAGDPKIAEQFNQKAFINCADYNDLNEVLNIVKKLDNDDNAYLKMLSEPVFYDRKFIEKIDLKLEHFLLNIFEQEIEYAYRRPQGPKPGVVMLHEEKLLFINKLCKSKTLNILRLIIKKFQKIFNSLLDLF